MQLRFDYPAWMAHIVARNLLWRTKFHQEWTEEERKIYLDQAIDLCQHVFLQEEDGLIVGMVTWAWLDVEQEMRFARMESRLGDFKKASDEDVPWILDMVVEKPSKQRTQFMVRKLVEHWSNDSEFNGFQCARAFRPDGRMVKFYRDDRDTTV